MNEQVNVELEKAIMAMKISDEAMARAIENMKQMLVYTMDEMRLAIHAHSQAIEAALNAREINKGNK